MRPVRWKRGKYPGEIEATIGGKKYKIEKALDHNDRHKGEWKVMVWDRGDWEWETTEYGKANAKAWIMNKHNMKESTDWVCGKCNCEPCTCGEVNEESPATSIGNASVALPPTARFKTIQVTDRRRRKDKHPVLLKRFRKYVEDKKDA